MSNMTRAEAMKKIENCLMHHAADSERVELFNFQQYGFSDKTVYEMLKTVVSSNPELDPNGEFTTTQAILVFEPSQERVRAAACRCLSDYCEADFVEECGYIEKINEYFPGAHLTSDEIRAAFRKS